MNRSTSSAPARLAAAAVALFACSASAAALPFYDGFESDFTTWTSTRSNGTNALGTSTTVAFDGRKALQFNYAGDGSNAQAAAVLDFTTATTTPAVRFFLYVPSATESAMASSTSLRLVRLGDAASGATGTGGNAKVNLLLKKDGQGRQHLALEYVNSTGSLVSFGTGLATPITSDTWHFVEFSFRPGPAPAAGSLKVFVDDVQNPRIDAAPTDIGASLVATAWVGLADQADNQTAPLTVLIDGVGVATSPSGTTQLTAQHYNEFESGTLLISSTPPGKAAQIVGGGAGLTLSGSAQAAHQGSFGLRSGDQDGQSGAGAGIFERTYISAASGTVYRRTWWRAVTPNGAGSRAILSIGSSALTNASLADVLVSGAGAISVGGVNATSTYTVQSGTVTATANSWHLVELLVTGLGTTTGVRSVYVDRALAATQSGINWTGVSADELMEGQVSSSDRTYQGFDDFDDLRTAKALLPSALKMTVPALTDGTCSGAIAVEARDSTNALRGVAVTVDAQLAVSGASGSFFSDSTCATPLPGNSVTLTVGSSSAQVYFKSSTAGPASFTATHPDYLSVPTAVTIASLATKLAFWSTPFSASAGDCNGAVVIESRTATNNAATVSSNVQLALTSSSSGNTFYSDTGCLTPATQVTLSASTSQTVFFFRDTTAGTPTLTVAGTGFSAVNQGQSISPAAAAKLVFNGTPITATAGACSTAISIQTQDSFGNAAPVSGDTQLTVTTSSGTGALHADASCSSSGGAPVISSGSSSTTVYYRDTKSGTPTLTATAAGLQNGSQQQTVNAAAPNRIVFTSSPQTLGAGSCSAATSVQLLDQYANVAKAAASLTLNLSSNPSSVAFFTASGCGGTSVTQLTVGTGNSAANFFFRANTSGSPAITVSASGITSASQQESVTAGSATKLSFGAPPNASAGVCAGPLIIQSQDSLGNATQVSAATQVSLSTTSSTMGFFSSGACNSSITDATINAGSSSTAIYFRDTVSGNATLTASSTGFTDATLVQTIKPSPPNQLVFVSTGRTTNAGACSQAITVQTQDGFGNPSKVLSATPVSLSSSSASGTFSATSSCGAAITQVSIVAGQNQVTFYYRDTAAGTPTITAGNIGLTSPTQMETITAGAPTKLSFSSFPSTLVAGACSPAVTVQAQDSFGNAAAVSSALTVNLSSTSATTAFHGDAACSGATNSAVIAAGSSSVDVFLKDGSAGTAQLTAAASGLASAQHSAVFAAGMLSGLAFATTPKTITAGQCSSVMTVQTVDQAGNVVNVAADTQVQVKVDASLGGLFSDSSCTQPVTLIQIDAGGNSAGFFFKGTKAGSVNVTADSSGLSSATQAQLVLAGPPSKVGFSGTGISVASGDCSAAMSVEVQDAFGNAAVATSDIPVAVTSSGPATAFFTDGTCATALGGLTIASGASGASFAFTETKAGALTLTATASGFGSGTQVETVAAKPPAALAFVTPARTVATDTCSEALTVELRDPADNPSPADADMDLLPTSDSPTGSFFADAQCQLPLSAATVKTGHTRSSIFYQDATNGTHTLTVNAGTLTSASQQLTVKSPGAAVALAFARPAEDPEAQSCSETFSVRLVDSEGLSVRSAQAVNVVLSADSSSVTFATDVACGVPTSQIALSANEYQVPFHLKDVRAESVHLKAAAAGLTDGKLPLTFACPAVGEGVACDDADLCNGRETCSQGACVSNAPLSCDDGDSCTTDSCSPAAGCANAVQLQCCSSPLIHETAPLLAAVGVAWQTKFALRGGTGPSRWSACDAPPVGFAVDATTGIARWIPATAGVQPLCVHTDGPCGSAEWRFDVDVQPAAPALPVAQLSVTPSVAIGTAVKADSVGSSGLAPLELEWNFGDGTPPVRETVASHVYTRAGGYVVRLTVRDAVGQTSVATAPVQVTGPGCAQPVVVKIAANALSGVDELQAELHVEADVPAAARVRWDFGDGTISTDLAPKHTFGKGSWPLRLTLLTEDACVSQDTARVVVSDGTKLPPLCEAYVEPVSGPAPLPVVFSASFLGVASGAWSFSDGLTVDALRADGKLSRTIESPGALSAMLEVKDADGLSCRASVDAEATNAEGVALPHIVSTPASSARCGQPWAYDDDSTAEAFGTGPIRWTVGAAGGKAGAPSGMQISSDGRVDWKPAVQRPGKVRVTLVAENDAGADTQDFLVNVECPEGQRPCGCDAALGAPMLLATCGLLRMLRRKR